MAPKINFFEAFFDMYKRRRSYADAIVQFLPVAIAISASVRVSFVAALKVNVPGFSLSKAFISTIAESCVNL